VPNKGKPVPVFVGLNFNGNHALLDDPDIALPTVWMRDGNGVENNRATDAGRGKEIDVWNIRYVVEHGYAVATFYSGDVDPDKDDPTDGVQPHFRKAGITREGPDEWATLAAWAYGIHRAVDYLHSDKDIDTSRIACVGHSRNGKTALLAAAFDDRIDLAIPLQAGCGGTAPSRGTVGESVKAINDHFPHWFDAHFKAFNEHTDQLPFDQHCLIALCAPRPVLLSNATEDQWANPAGQFEMLKAAAPVYELLGAEGCSAGAMPETGKLVDSRLGYWIRPGKHSMTRADWETFIRFADKHFGRAQPRT
jgi:(4-O-methyl)-D-glucuronate---lignin esterase